MILKFCPIWILSKKIPCFISIFHFFYLHNKISCSELLYNIKNIWVECFITNSIAPKEIY